MILVTGASGFIGGAIVRRLLSENKPVRVLLHQAPKRRSFPKNVLLDTAITSITDIRGVGAALKDVTDVIHCASAEWDSPQVDLETVDIQGTSTLLSAIQHSGIHRLVYFSHVSSDRASLFTMLKVKAIVEELIRKSKVPHTIVRCTAVVGEKDHLISWLASALKRSPLFFTLPGDGKEIIQPLWIDDLTAVTLIILNDEKMANKTLPAGGGEYFSFREIIQKLSIYLNIKKLLFPIAPAYLRSLRLWFGENSRLFPLGSYWLDYLAADRTCALDVLPRHFGILPTRFDRQLELLKMAGLFTE
jgi:uncharacterized protein YbjT (DUF2867 family)